LFAICARRTRASDAPNAPPMAAFHPLGPQKAAAIDAYIGRIGAGDDARD